MCENPRIDNLLILFLTVTKQMYYLLYYSFVLEHVAERHVKSPCMTMSAKVQVYLDMPNEPICSAAGLQHVLLRNESKSASEGNISLGWNTNKSCQNIMRNTQ